MKDVYKSFATFFAEKTTKAKFKRFCARNGILEKPLRQKAPNKEETDER